MIIKEEKGNSLAKAPEGKIHVVKGQGRVQFYLRTNPNDKSGEYLQKSNSDLIKKLLQKSYDERILRNISREIKTLELFLKRVANIDYPKTVKSVFSDQPEQIKDIIEPVDTSDEDYARAWQDEPYVKKIIAESSTIWETNKKEIVRSKSELNIANALANNGIPYKYECPLRLKDGIIIHPDFTVLNKRTRKVFYWEHRGMMDDREYVKHTVPRIKDYIKSGILPGDNLIITEETLTSPLGTNEINAIMRLFV